MKIYVDADASPVKDIVISAGQKARIPVVLVQSFAHFSHETAVDGVEVIYVDTGADAADYRIIKLAEENDIIITQDYGLAALGLSKGCTVLHHKGFAYTNDNIDRLLTTRHANAKARRGGQKTKGPKPLTDEDKARFQALLWETIKKIR
ncbi:MAG TPA: YaiI/YqxD family protein [Bacillota bacterium]|nr:YaiI/YqxD family protein [Bacillota bacterium]